MPRRSDADTARLIGIVKRIDPNKKMSSLLDQSRNLNKRILEEADWNRKMRLMDEMDALERKMRF